MGSSSDTAHRPTGDARRTRSRRTVLIGALALVTITGITTGTVAVVHHDRAPHGASGAPVRPRTTTVLRTDLSDSQTLPGTLGYGGGHTLKGAGDGVLTRLPKTGTLATRGKPLYWVDDRPVMVFLGDTPLFRALGEPGAKGRDVATVADNLVALGYDIGPRQTTAQSAGGPPGAVLTPSLAAAVKRWQHDTGQKATGTLDVGRIVVLPGPARVSDLKAQLGDAVDAAPLLSLTSTAKVVTVTMDATDVGGIAKGDTVRITLPDTTVIPGKVTAVGQTVQADPQSGDPSGGTPRLDVTVTPADPADVKKLQAAPVQVAFTTSTRQHVLAVPVGALLALSEGGYALQRPGGTLVAAETGMFAKGMVEVSGKGVVEGMRVVTAS